MDQQAPNIYYIKPNASSVCVKMKAMLGKKLAKFGIVLSRVEHEIEDDE